MLDGLSCQSMRKRLFPGPVLLPTSWWNPVNIVWQVNGLYLFQITFHYFFKNLSLTTNSFFTAGFRELVLDPSHMPQQISVKILHLSHSIEVKDYFEHYFDIEVSTPTHWHTLRAEAIPMKGPLTVLQRLLSLLIVWCSWSNRPKRIRTNWHRFQCTKSYFHLKKRTHLLVCYWHLTLAYLKFNALGQCLTS